MTTHGCLRSGFCLLFIIWQFIYFYLYSACSSSWPVGTMRLGSQKSCTTQYWRLHKCIFLFLCLVVSQLLLCQSHLLQFGIGYTCRQGLIPAPQNNWLCLRYTSKNLAFSVHILGLLLGFSWRAASPGCWLVWWGWGEAWGDDSVVLCWQNNRVCQDSVSHLVLCHPSILVEYSKLC